MSDTYTDIGTSRLAAGKLWSPDLSIDLLGRDWVALDGGFSFYIPVATRAAGSGSGVFVLDTFYVYFPDDWALDDTFDDLEVRCSFTLYFYRSTSGATADFTVWVGDSTDTYTDSRPVTWDTPYLPVTFDFSFPASAVPTGKTAFRIRCQRDQDGTNTLYCKQDVMQPVQRIYVRYVPS